MQQLSFVGASLDIIEKKRVTMQGKKAVGDKNVEGTQHGVLNYTRATLPSMEFLKRTAWLQVNTVDEQIQFFAG